MSTRDANSTVSGKQIKYIYLCARELGLDHDMLHEIVFKCTKKRSISCLTTVEAGSVIDVLAREAFPHQSRQKSNVVYLITMDQVNMLKDLAERMAWGDDQINRLSERMYKKPYQKLKAREAQGLIEGMKSIFSRKEVRHG